LYVRADYILHPPSGSSYPGKEEANPYVFYPPNELRRLLDLFEQRQSDLTVDDARKIKSALKQWERVFVDQIGYPWRLAAALRVAAYRLLKKAEIMGPAINLDYYQDAETPAGFEEILDDYKSTHDQENMVREDYNRQGERPVPDTPSPDEDLLTRSEGIFETSVGPGGVSDPDGAGPEPEGYECPFPPTGGDIDRL
jgi:hypothetical protein